MVLQTKSGFGAWRCPPTHLVAFTVSSAPGTDYRQPCACTHTRDGEGLCVSLKSFSPLKLKTTLGTGELYFSEQPLDRLN